MLAGKHQRHHAGRNGDSVAADMNAVQRCMQAAGDVFVLFVGSVLPDMHVPGVMRQLVQIRCHAHHRKHEQADGEAEGQDPTRSA